MLAGQAVVAVETVNGIYGILIALISGGTLITVARMNTRVKKVQTTSDGTLNAVNHVEPGAPTLVQRVDLQGQQIRVDRIWQQQAMGSIATQIGVRLPPAPPELLPAKPVVPLSEIT